VVIAVIIIECPQGSREWHQARAGVITASMFTVVRQKVGMLTEQQAKYVESIRSGLSQKEAMEAAGYKAKPTSSTIDRAIAGERIGDFSDVTKKYAFALAIERINGEPLDEGFETYAMRRGHELEPFARSEHERQSGLEVDRAGFILTDDRAFGCSADGLIGQSSGSEYKCFMDPERLYRFHIENDASEVFDQAQGCMWITGRTSWHIGLYCPALKSVDKQLWWREFPRDDNYIERMEADLWEFKLLVDDLESRLRMKAA
jgi:hypothetical protein